MKHTKQIVSSLILAAACTLAQGAPRDLAPPGFASAHRQFVAGANGDQAARDAAIAAFRALDASLPGHPILAIYAGAATALKGRDERNPLDKLKFAEQGANMIEKGLAQLDSSHDQGLFNGSPESLEARLVAARTLLSLPEFMQRAAQGKRALAAALASPAFAAGAPAVRAGLLAASAQLAAGERRSADEIALLRQVLAAAPGSGHSARAAARLKELGQ